MDLLSGAVERVTYYNAENGYSVIRLRPERRNTPGLDREGLATVVGNLPELTPGEHVRLQGDWVQHAKHGAQFQVQVCEQTLPATAAGIRKYLGSGLVKGIGPRLAERIVDHFGAETLEVIEQQPGRLREVSDIGPKRARLILEAWQEQKQVKEIMLFLHSHNVSTNLAIKIYKQYGEKSLSLVQTDPYQLAQDITGVGFKTADRIARDLGLPFDHPSRVEAGTMFVLNEMVDNGHVYAPRAMLAEKATELLQVDTELVEKAITRLENGGRIRLENVPQAGGEKEKNNGVREAGVAYQMEAAYHSALYTAENGLAQRLKMLGRALPSRLSDLPPMFLTMDNQLSGEQQQAVRAAITNPVSVLTGGPGTGKTTAIRALIGILEESHKRYALASPTGRAAKRLAEASGRPASTIHRLLGYSPKEGFKHNPENPLDIDLLVVDEASMLELVLAFHLVKALEAGTHILFVGDVDQLPSVGAGDVLREIIRSEVGHVTRLNVIFRQVAGSQIITNAHRINQGEMPIFPIDKSDFYLFPAETAEESADWVLDVVTQRVPQKFGFDAQEDIQVLSPMYRGPAGVSALNIRLQEQLNPPGTKKTEKSLFGQVFRSGDKVMQTQNNYDKEVFNGDIGRVREIDLIEHTLTVEIDGRPVNYDWAEADQLTLAYAVSVHKAQGAEFPVIVMPVVTQHYLMLQRNLLYTGITRAKKLCVLVGSKKAIAIAVRNNTVAQRFTALAERMKH